jgi:hypothetical protein
MVSLAQIDKCREMSRAGYDPVPHRDDVEPSIGGPTLMVRNNPEYVFVMPDGSLREAGPLEVSQW